jgi:hypothetical protein
MLSKKERRAKISALTEVYETRRANLRLAASHVFGGNFAALAFHLGVSPQYISQLIGPSPVRTISETNARDFERRLKVASGWLDLAR